MKKLSYFIYLLFFVLILSSCTGAYSFYKQGNYEKAIQAANTVKNPSAEDYYAKAMSLHKLGRTEEAKDSAILFLLMSDNPQLRPEIADIFINLKNTDLLNILLLQPEDGIKSQITLYKSFIALKQTEKAQFVFENYITSGLNIMDQITLLVNFPYNMDKVTDFIINSVKFISLEQRSEFIQLILKHSKNPVFDQYSATYLINLVNAINDNLNSEELSNCYYLIGNSLYVLQDIENAKKYWNAALKLNPENEELKNCINEK